MLKVIAVGDPHFKENHLAIAEKFVNHTIQVVKKSAPDFVVILGDLLDTHNVVRVHSHKLAIRFLKSLGELCPTFLVIGNHDLIDAGQYLTDNHIFTPLHGVESLTNVWICDKAKMFSFGGYGEYSVVFCPYVPPGRFIQALNTTIDQKGNIAEWWMADCIFAHQEFRGCNFGACKSEIGDQWPQEYPLVVSGHIHDAQRLGENIYYTGSAIQHSFAESNKKGVWELCWQVINEMGEKKFTHRVLENGIREKKTITLSVEQAKKFKVDSHADSEIEWRIKIIDAPEKIATFRKTGEEKKLQQLGIKVLIADTKKQTICKTKGSFWDNLYSLVEQDVQAMQLLRKYL